MAAILAAMVLTFTGFPPLYLAEKGENVKSESDTDSPGGVFA